MNRGESYGTKKKNDEVRHSDTYLGADFSEGLKHYKYIKRYRNSNGEWRYVYANDKVHERIQKRQDAARKERYKVDNQMFMLEEASKYNPHSPYGDAMERGEFVRGLKQFIERGKAYAEKYDRLADLAMDRNAAKHLAPGHNRYLGNRKRTM